MADQGPSWERFCNRNLGKWTGRSIALHGDSARLVCSREYTLSTESLSPLKSNSDFMLLNAKLDVNASGAHGESGLSADSAISVRYDANSLWVFEDGSYTSDTRLLSLSCILPRDSVIPFAIEHSLSLSATERVRAFLTYDADDHLETVVILEEAREGLFENRAPLAFTSLVGNWNGQAEAFRRPSVLPSSRGFGPSKRQPGANAPQAGLPQQEHSQEDLPDELKHGSAGKEGLMRMKTSVSYGWDPQTGSVRRSTFFSDMQNVELGRSTLYGKIQDDEGGLFDVIRCSDNSVIVTLSNGCYVSAPRNRARGIPASSELGCLITPHFRRRCVRTYAAHGLASELLASESRPL